MKRTIFFIQILLLFTAGSAFGADEYYGDNPNVGPTYWWSGSTDNLFSNEDSWWFDGQDHFPPGANDVASIDNPLPAYCLVDEGECLELHIGNWPASYLSAGDGLYPIPAVLDVNGGTLTVGEDVLIGLHDTTLPSDYAIGDFNIISGTVTVGEDLFIGREGIGILNMRGGSLTVGGTIWCPGWELPYYSSQTYDYGTGELNLYGGTIMANDLMVYDEDGGETYINIGGGTLILSGDKRSKITDLMNEGKLYHGAGGDIVVDYNVSNTGKTTVIGVFDPNRVTYPIPGNYDKDVSLTAQLSWEAGASAASHDVYFGTTFDDVNEANNTPGVWPEFKGNQPLAETDYDPCDPCAPDPGALASFTTYYWRIDEVNDTTIWRGNVWRFITVDPYLASNPNPAHRMIEIPIEKTLRWTKGIAANSHEVYLGTSFSDVNTSTTPTFTTPNPLYNPPENLLFDETYYWRVDEVDTVTDTNWPGRVWRFKTRPYKDVDDFDNYVVWVEAGGADWDRVIDSPFNDTKALQLDYSNTSSPWDSNVTRPFEETPTTNRRDWVSGGVEIFRIRFHGEEDNAVEQLYVTLTDADGNSATVLYSDSNHIVQQSHELWREWSIDIEEFSDAGVNLADVRYFTIGLGDGASPGGSGTVYFDDIGLYRPMCVNQDGDADLNNDCAVDINDIELLADDWLKTGYDVNINVGTYDMNVGLILWYKFDEGSGYVAGDSSVNNNPGSLGLANWESPGYPGSGGSCVYFLPIPDHMCITVPPAAAPNDLGGHSTVALWIKDAGVVTEIAGEPVPVDAIGSQLFQAGPGMQGNLQASLEYNGYFEFVCGWDIENNWQDTVVWGEEGYNNPEHPLGQWVHYAFVKDATEGVMRIYQNGKIVAEQDENTGLKIAEIIYFSIGAWRWAEGTGGYYAGSMDDFRLYNRALSQQEVMDLANVSSLHQPVLSSAEVTGDDTVNFEDYAVTAAEWLEDPLLWPY